MSIRSGHQFTRCDSAEDRQGRYPELLVSLGVWPHHLTEQGLPFRGNLPLDDEAGCKLTLIFKLQERVKEIDRVELIVRRADRFTREEAAYWLSRLNNFSDDANRWAISGLRIVLGGHAKDPAVERMLERLRASA
jgi:hypothetical protein